MKVAIPHASHDTSAATNPLLSPGELSKGDFPRDSGTGDSESSGVKVCGERTMRVLTGREGGGMIWFQVLTGGENG